MSTTESITNWLFETEALRVCQPDQPFWYTSGTLGPYYINTHFLFGSEDSANRMLTLIETCSKEPLTMPQKLAQACQQQYQENRIYRELCDIIVREMARDNFDFISGGERRDFFFSIQPAILLDKPHMSIMKDGRCLISEAGLDQTRPVEAGEFEGQTAYHVADLVTQASSYERAWIPAVRQSGASMPKTMAVVDRDQGGREVLSDLGTELVALTKIDQTLFDHAKTQGLISQGQYDMIMRFTEDPIAFMKDFLKSHPDFIRQQIEMGGKNRDRALLCQDKGYANKT